MSEPNSLFAKIHITKNNFENFLKAKPREPKFNGNWSEWWNSKVMYNRVDLQEKDIYCYKDSTNEAIINGWKGAKHSLTFSDYDLESEIWNFGIIMFSENYLEMIPGLAFIKSVDEFKTENSEDFAIIYSHFWGDEDVYAYINYENGIWQLDNRIKNKTDVKEESMEYAEEYLRKKFDEFGDLFKELD